MTQTKLPSNWQRGFDSEEKIIWSILAKIDVICIFGTQSSNYKFVKKDDSKYITR